MAKEKITIVGAGNVGATAAHIAAMRNTADVVLLDIVEGLAEAKALDIAEAGGVGLGPGGVSIIGSTDWHKAADSNIVVITSGIPRRAGMSRDDLLAKNVKIVKQVSENIVKYCPDSIVIVVCNPLDAMVYTCAKVTGFSNDNVMGMAGALDCARFSYFLASHLSVGIENIRCLLMGGHGDDMVPLPRFTTVGGKAVTELVDEGILSELIERTRKGGIEIVNLLGASAYYAPAAGIVKMTEAILQDKKEVICCCAYCDGQYDAGGYFVGVPAVLGKGGVEKIVELDLNGAERADFEKSLAHVKRLAAKVDTLL